MQRQRARAPALLPAYWPRRQRQPEHLRRPRRAAAAVALDLRRRDAEERPVVHPQLALDLRRRALVAERQRVRAAEHDDAEEAVLHERRRPQRAVEERRLVVVAGVVHRENCAVTRKFLATAAAAATASECAADATQVRVANVLAIEIAFASHGDDVRQLRGVRGARRAQDV